MNIDDFKVGKKYKNITWNKDMEPIEILSIYKDYNLYLIYKNIFGINTRTIPPEDFKNWTIFISDSKKPKNWLVDQPKGYDLIDNYSESQIKQYVLRHGGKYLELPEKLEWKNPE